jgi:hypothetical protein
MRENISSLFPSFERKKSSVLGRTVEENKDFYIWPTARQKGEIAGGNFGFHEHVTRCVLLLDTR